MNSVRQLDRSETVARVPNGLLAKLTGLAIVSLVPAIFWTGVLALVGFMLSINFSAQALFFVGLLIAIFLSIVFGSLALSSNSQN